jgi:tetratricopeptide (TPR) repeat protein
LPIRQQVRAELVEASESPQVASAAKEMCQFYTEHRQNDASHNLAEYISLALNLGNPPDFTPKFQEADLPPDVGYVLGFVPLLKRYAAAAQLHSVWMKHQAQYNGLIDQYHEPVARMITATDTYLRMPLAGYLGRSYTIYLEPMSAPGQVNSRNYRQDEYYMVVAPQGNNIHMPELRHTYLHFVLDPLIAKRATALQRLRPILASVQTAPMAQEYKDDMGLLLIESLIRAIEARTPSDPKLSPVERQAMVKRSEGEGFILTGYFYEQLRDFEKENTGLQDAFPDWLHNLDVDSIRKLASNTRFASAAEPEVIHSAKGASQSRVEQAERALASGNPSGAAQLAQEALSAKEDPAKAYFVLARVATLSGNMEEAHDDFSKSLESAKDPRVAAWCHIYLGRIYDLQDSRDEALAQYKAALEAGDISSDTKAAAERGLKEQYQPPAARQQSQ